MNLASKREDSNRATSPHISRPSDPMGGFHRPLNRANHVTVSRGQVVPDSSRWSRGRGQVACNHLASRFIGGSLFLIPGEKNGCVASLSQASASGFQIHLWVSFINTRKNGGVASLSQANALALYFSTLLYSINPNHSCGDHGKNRTYKSKAQIKGR